MVKKLYLKGLTYSEIAEKMGASRNQIAGILKRLRQDDPTLVAPISKREKAFLSNKGGRPKSPRPALEKPAAPIAPPKRNPKKKLGRFEALNKWNGF